MEDLITLQKVFRSIFYIHAAAKTMVVPPDNLEHIKSSNIREKLMKLMELYTFEK